MLDDVARLCHVEVVEDSPLRVNDGGGLVSEPLDERQRVGVDTYVDFGVLQAAVVEEPLRRVALDACGLGVEGDGRGLGVSQNGTTSTSP